VASEPFDLITMGRVGVDIYPEQPGPFAAVDSFAKSIGGTATNVAVAAARLGRRVALVTKVGDDALGAYVRGALDGFGVDTRYVLADASLPTPVVFCELDPPDDPRIIFYRYPKAPDMEIAPADLDLDAIAAARIFWVTGTGLSDEPHRSALFAGLAARERRPITVLDLDWRPMFWPDRDEAAPLYRRALEGVTVAVGNRDEVEIAVGTREPAVAAERLLEAGVGIAIVKLGSEGVLVGTPDRLEVVPPVPVTVVCGLGAGDAFGGALCHRLLAGDDPVDAVRFANAAGAIVASRLLCADAMPTEAEVRDLLQAAGT
jgi:5-dehydro-2-deoxygluconokinase